MGTLATRLLSLRLQAPLTNEEILRRLKRRTVLVTEEQTATGGVETRRRLLADLSDKELGEIASGLVGVEVGLTQEELAERTKQFRPGGFDRATISKLERADRLNPRLETLTVLAQALSAGPGPAVLIDDLVTNPTKQEKPSTLLRRITAKVQTIEDSETLQAILDYIEFKRR